MDGTATLIIEALAARTLTQEAIASISTDPAAQSSASSDIVNLLPKGHVEKQDEYGHWSYHTAPKGDLVPDLAADMDHHCRTCGISGTADNIQNAILASMTVGVVYATGLFPCHTYACTNVGLYCKKVTDEQYAEFLKNDRKRRRQ